MGSKVLLAIQGQIQPGQSLCGVLMPDWGDSPAQELPDVLPRTDMPLILGLQDGR